MPRPPHARTERRAHRPWGSMVRMALKLGILTPFLWSTQSAVNDQARALAERLTAAGHRVTVIAPSADRPAVEEAQRNVQAVLTGERETVFLPDEPYPRYFFANESQDILGIAGAVLNRVGVEWRFNRPNSISIAKRASVALMDRHVGPKT